MRTSRSHFMIPRQARTSKKAPKHFVDDLAGEISLKHFRDFRAF